MAYGRRDGFSYLDGVQVKVSERFRPPRKVVLPFSLSRNLLPQSLNFEYDFSTELKAIEQAEDYRKAQKARQEACVEKVGSDIEQFTQSGAVCNGSLGASEKVNQGENVGSLMAMPAIPSNSILLPAPAAEAKIPASQKNQKGFSLAEFENDTSSPFDYMELQTINDMEELNSVFQGMSGAVSESKEETRNVDKEQTRQDTERIPQDVCVANGAPTTNPVEDSTPVRPSAELLCMPRSPSDRHLFSDGGPLGSNKAMLRQLPEAPSGTESLHRKATRPALSPELEQLLQSVIDMGFPEDRALRVIQRHGADNKKVIEHLCQIQSLIDEGFSGEDSESALTENQDSYTQALEFLKLQQQFLALGFPKERISSALHEFNNDRDRALDSLLA